MGDGRNREGPVLGSGAVLTGGSSQLEYVCGLERRWIKGDL
jgi:hypothetical protein